MKGNSKHQKKQGPKKASTQVNRPRLKQQQAPNATGFDFQTFFRESKVKRKVGGQLKDAVVIEGMEYLAPVAVPDSFSGIAEVPGQVYNEIYLAPGEFGGTRLSLYARLYEKFLFEEMDFMYLPAVGSGTPGQLVIAHDRDISDPTPPATQQGVRQFMAMEDQKSGNVWNPHVAKCPLRSIEEGFFCNPVVGGDDRLAYQGQVYVACVVPTGLNPGATIGTLLIRYKCVFMVPQLENELLVATVDEEGDPTELEVPLGTISEYDFLSYLAPLWQGNLTWQPKLQGDGTFASTLQEGLYRWEANMGGEANPAGGGILAAIEPPLLEALEPMPAPAPQPEAKVFNQTSVSMPSGGDPISTATWSGYLNVPRGGARLRQRMNASTFGSTSTNIDNPNFFTNLIRLGGYVFDLASALTPKPSPRWLQRARLLGVDPKGLSPRTLRLKCKSVGQKKTGGNAGSAVEPLVPLPSVLERAALNCDAAQCGLAPTAVAAVTSAALGGPNTPLPAAAVQRQGKLICRDSQGSSLVLRR